MNSSDARRDLVTGVTLAVALHLALLLLLGATRRADTPPQLAQPATTRVTIQLPAAQPSAVPPTPATAEPVSTALPRPEAPPPRPEPPSIKPIRPVESLHKARPTQRWLPNADVPPDTELIATPDRLRHSTVALPVTAPISQIDLDGDFDVAPRPREAIRPVYPYGARQRGEAGRVVVEIRISPLGRVEAVILRESSGYEALDRAARKAIQNARFEPARRGTTPVTARVRMTIVFQLTGTAAVDNGSNTGDR